MNDVSLLTEKLYSETNILEFSLETIQFLYRIESPSAGCDEYFVFRFSVLGPKKPIK